MGFSLTCLWCSFLASLSQLLLSCSDSLTASFTGSLLPHLFWISKRLMGDGVSRGYSLMLMVLLVRPGQEGWWQRAHRVRGCVTVSVYNGRLVHEPLNLRIQCLFPRYKPLVPGGGTSRAHIDGRWGSVNMVTASHSGSALRLLISDQSHVRRMTCTVGHVPLRHQKSGKLEWPRGLSSCWEPSARSHTIIPPCAPWHTAGRWGTQKWRTLSPFKPAFLRLHHPCVSSDTLCQGWH